MERGAKPAKATVEARRRVARKSRTPDATTRPQLGQRLAEALEQQAAMSEILRVISSSPTDLQSVFGTIVRRASQLCEGHRTSLVRLEGDTMHLAAQFNAKPRTVASATFPRPLARDIAAGRAILDGAPVQIPDVKKDREFSPGLAQTLNLGSILSVPLLRDGKPIGAISVSRASRGTFPENRIALLKTFADQAIIAIENARLFTELTQKNRALTQAHAQVSEALERQTATSEVLRVISSSPTDVQPVFETIVAVRRVYAVPNPPLCIGSMVKSSTLSPDITSVPRRSRRTTAGFRVHSVKRITYSASWTAPCLMSPISRRTRIRQAVAATCIAPAACTAPLSCRCFAKTA